MRNFIIEILQEARTDILEHALKDKTSSMDDLYKARDQKILDAIDWVKHADDLKNIVKRSFK